MQLKIDYKDFVRQPYLNKKKELVQKLNRSVKKQEPNLLPTFRSPFLNSSYFYFYSGCIHEILHTNIGGSEVIYFQLGLRNRFRVTNVKSLLSYVKKYLQIHTQNRKVSTPQYVLGLWLVQYVARLSNTHKSSEDKHHVQDPVDPTVSLYIVYIENSAKVYSMLSKTVTNHVRRTGRWTYSGHKEKSYCCFL